MAGINFLSENFFKTGTKTLTTGAENAQFPLNNVSNDSPSVKFRSDGNTVVMEIDLLQTRDIDTLALVGDPTESFGMTAVSYKTAATTDFSGSPVYNLTLVPSQNLGYSYITEVSHRFVEITFTGQGSYVEVGSIFIGKRINLSQNNLSIGSFSYGYRDQSRVRTNNYGQKFINELPIVKTLGGTIEFCTKAEQETLDDMFIRHGKHEPLWMIVDMNSESINEGASKLTVYGYLEAIPSWSATGGQTYNASLNVRQAI